MTYKPTHSVPLHVEPDGKRSEPKAGELWEFDNGIIATIMEPGTDGVTDLAQTDPEDYRTAFKFNSVRDPMPIRKIVL